MAARPISRRLGLASGTRATPSGNALRAAVLGANDGLVSNLCLVMGVAGADPGREVVILAGLAALLAGSLSMALGEWISVRSSTEAYERQRAELEDVPRVPGAPRQPEPQTHFDAWVAAVTSFLTFSVGAIIPLIPWFFAEGTTAVVLSAVFSGAALFAAGAIITRYTGRSILFSGTRMLLIGAAAAAVTYFLGKIIGISTGV